MAKAFAMPRACLKRGDVDARWESVDRNDRHRIVRRRRLRGGRGWWRHHSAGNRAAERHCRLAGIFKVPSVTTTVLAGPPDNCIVASDTGAPLAAWSFSLAQAKTVYDALTFDPSTVVVSGIGDKAAIVQNTGLLVLKGDALIVISISGGADLSADEAIEVSKQIGAIAAGRM